MDARLRAVANLVPPCERVCDVGSDHGLLPAYLLENGVCKQAIVTDISAPSLKKAQTLFSERGLSAQFLVADGLIGVPQADVYIIAGMGGGEMIRIFDRSFLPEKVVLQPMRDAPLVRQYLVEKGRRLITDCTVACKGQFYSLISAEVGEDTLTRAETLFGKTNLSVPTADFVHWIEAEKRKNLNILSSVPEGHPDRIFADEYGVMLDYILLRVQLGGEEE